MRVLLPFKCLGAPLPPQGKDLAASHDVREVLDQLEEREVQFIPRENWPNMPQMSQNED